MRVLHLVATLESGGAEKQLYLLCRHTRSRIAHTVLAVERAGPWSGRLAGADVEVRLLASALRNPLTPWRLRRAVCEASPDVVHCWLPSMNLLGAVGGPPRPVIASVRNVDTWKGWAYRMADRMASSAWTAVICNSWAGAEFTIASGIAREKVHVVPNGIEPRRAAERPARAGGGLTACCVCRIVPQKRVDRIVALARRMPDVHWLIAGDGPGRAGLEAEAPPNVEFLGHTPDPSGVYARSDFFVLASEREGMSNALLEAMQSGCVPVVTPAGDAARMVEDGVSGRVAPFERMEDALRSAANRLDGLRLEAIAGAARYSAGAMAEATLEVYRKVTEHGLASPDPLPRLHQPDRNRWRATESGVAPRQSAARPL